MAANIFVVADGRTEGCTGFGIIVAREGKTHFEKGFSSLPVSKNLSVSHK
jgi:hypothetical protein